MKFEVIFGSKWRTDISMFYAKEWAMCCELFEVLHDSYIYISEIFGHVCKWYLDRSGRSISGPAYVAYDSLFSTSSLNSLCRLSSSYRYNM